jgi:hypothetical protein
MERRDSGPNNRIHSMKKFMHPRAALLAAIIAAVFPISVCAQIVIGTGSDASYAVIQAPAFGDPLHPLIYEYRYDYDSLKPLDGYHLMTAIDSAVPELNLDFINFGDDESPNYFLNSVTYGTTKVTNTPSPAFAPFWAQWVSGGEAGYPAAAPIPSGAWSFGSGISSPYRSIAPGSSDGFVFNDGDIPPAVSPIPEPRAAALLLGGVILLVIRLIRRGAFARAGA